MFDKIKKYGFGSHPNFQINDKLWKFAHTDNLLHIHIPKCGGTWLKQIVYNTLGGHHRFNFGHLPISVIKGVLDDQRYNWDDFKPFAIIRNPWDRLWSAYKYTKWGGAEVNLKAVEWDEPSETFSTKQKQNNVNTLWVNIPEKKLPIFNQGFETLNSLREKSADYVEKGWITNNMLTKSNFKEYVTNLHKLIKPTKIEGHNFTMPQIYYGGENLWNKKITYNIYLAPQIDYLVDTKGEIIVPNIFKSTEIGKFMDWAEKNTKDKYIKKRAKNHASYNKSTNQIHYENVYDDEMINMVGELYKKDIETFNFDFHN